jgi:hypothetical protein
MRCASSHSGSIGWLEGQTLPKNVSTGEIEMVRFPTIVTAAFAVFITTAAYAQPTEITADAGQKLTLYSAKEAVRSQLNAAGRHDVQPGDAEYVSGGDVDVAIVTSNNLVVRHVIVHANGGQITDARATTKPRG